MKLRLIKRIRRHLIIWRGRIRLAIGFCPECNSDAPKLYTCPVCSFYHGVYPPTKETKQKWWRRFTAIRGT